MRGSAQLTGVGFKISFFVSLVVTSVIIVAQVNSWKITCPDCQVKHSIFLASFISLLIAFLIILSNLFINLLNVI
jgi:hypothetical protein